MAVPSWLVHTLTGNPFGWAGDGTLLNKVGAWNQDINLIPILSGMDAAGPRNQAFATKLGTQLTGQQNMWNRIADWNTPLWPQKQSQSSTPTQQGLINMPFGG